MELETAFYAIAIIFMGVIFILLAALVATALVIKAKINRLQKMVDEKKVQAKSLASSVFIGLNTLRYFIKK